MNKENGNSKIDLKTPVMVIQFGKQADNTRVRNGLEEHGIHCIEIYAFGRNASC